MTIEIDDAGSGSLIGGTGIGILRVETDEYFFRLIPLLYFQPPYFQKKYYQTYVIRIIQNAFSDLGVTKKEPVRVCRGYIFDTLREWLTCEEYDWTNTKIEGTLQHKVEESFNDYIFDLGLPRNFIIHARYAFGFHRLLKWVFADFPNRAKLCKTGWKSWQKWSVVPYESLIYHTNKDLFCLKCGLPIKSNDEITMLKYTTNKEWLVYLHPECYVYPQLKPGVSEI